MDPRSKKNAEILGLTNVISGQLDVTTNKSVGWDEGKAVSEIAKDTASNTATEIATKYATLNACKDVIRIDIQFLVLYINSLVFTAVCQLIKYFILSKACIILFDRIINVGFVHIFEINPVSVSKCTVRPASDCCFDRSFAICL